MSPLRSAVSRCTRTAAVAAVVGTCGLAMFLGATGAAGAAGAAWADDDGTTPAEHLTLTPSYGGARTTVTVRAQCTGGGHGGTVSSPAFVRTVTMHRDATATKTATERATATVRPGLRPGRRYVVTANCSPTESLSASFAFTARRPAGSAHAGYGGTYHHAQPTPSDGGLDSATLALGGGLATAGLAGYVLTARRLPRARRRSARLTHQGGRR